MQALRKFALKYPEAQEGLAGEGTAVECVTVHVRNKTFLFVSDTIIRLKLSDSLPEAAEARHEGAVPLRGRDSWLGEDRVSKGDSLPLDLFKKWIDERAIAWSRPRHLWFHLKPTVWQAGNRNGFQN